MRRNPIHTLVSDSDTKASKSDTKNVDEIVTFIQKLITGARTKRTGCFILPLATLAFGEPALSLGSLPNIIPERHNAVVADRLLHWDTKDRVSHHWPERSRPLPAYDAIIFAKPILGHAGIIHRMPSDVGLLCFALRLLNEVRKLA
jgi:hypothetical protein